MQKKEKIKILIATEPDDVHAIAVKVALTEMGHKVRFLFIADLPTKQKNSIFFDHNGYQWKCTDNSSAIIDNHYDVVWWRRIRKPYIPKNLLHILDYDFAVRENYLLSESIANNVAPNAWWINKKEAALRASSKLYQLKIALESGILIPTTLCSNDPKDIRYFLLRYEEEGVIYKPLCANFWFEKEQVKISYTSRVKFADLPNNKLLQLVPGIFQKEIKKKYELRVVAFGDYLVAAKLHSQNHMEGKIDWRAIPVGQMKIEPYKLPTALSRKIKLFMAKMGIVFGSFDFIVTFDNKYIFLEVNEQGQFLWIEDYNQEFKILDIFVQFILNKSGEFIWKPQAIVHSTAKYEKEIKNILLHNLNKHINLNSTK